MFELQPTLDWRTRDFDQIRYTVGLNAGDRIEVGVPAGVSYLRLRIGRAEQSPTKKLLLRGSVVAGGSVELPLKDRWQTYYARLQGPRRDLVWFTSATPSSDPHLHLSLASAAVVDQQQFLRETSVDPPRQMPAIRRQPALALAPSTVNAEDDYLDELERTWDEFGDTDPLFYILTEESKRGGRWSLDEFFQTGDTEITEALDLIDSRGVPLSRGRALDFGCGAGRLTQALARHFTEVHGVDIAHSMLDLANTLNVHGSRVVYHHSRSSELDLAPGSFDFVYTNIVLQHMRPEYTRAYLDQFVDLLAPGGVLLFQLPSAPRLDALGLLIRLMPERSRLWYLNVRSKYAGTMGFYWIPRRKVLQHFKTHPVKVEGVFDDHSAPAVSYRYFVRKLVATTAATQRRAA